MLLTTFSASGSARGVRRDGAHPGVHLRRGPGARRSAAAAPNHRRSTSPWLSACPFALRSRSRVEKWWNFMWMSPPRPSVAVDHVEVEDRHGRQPAAPVQHAAGLVGGAASPPRSATMRLGTKLASMSKPPIFSFRSRNCSLVIWPALRAAEPVLDADVVERPAREARRRVAAEGVHRVVVGRGPRPVRIGRRGGSARPRGTMRVELGGDWQPGGGRRTGVDARGPRCAQVRNAVERRRSPRPRRSSSCVHGTPGALSE